MASSSDRIRSLDGMRAIGILVVFFGHLSGTKGFPFPERFSELATAGVTLFFVISGYLITTLLVGEHRGTGRISLKAFYVRRALRLVPAMVAFVAGVALFKWWQGAPLRTRDLVFALTWTSNYQADRIWDLGHLWSLAVEEQFYLLWPLAVVLLGVARSHLAAVAMFAISPLAIVGVTVLFRGSAIATLPMFPVVSYSLAIGCLVALWRDRLRANRYWRMASSVGAALPLMAVGFLAIYYSGYTLVRAFVVPIACIGFAAIIEGSTRWEGRPRTVLNSTPMVWIGTLSYSLYLWQQLFLNRAGTSIANVFPINVGLAFVAATLSYYLLEKPLLKLRARFRQRTIIER